MWLTQEAVCVVLSRVSRGIEELVAHDLSLLNLNSRSRSHSFSNCTLLCSAGIFCLVPDLKLVH